MKKAIGIKFGGFFLHARQSGNDGGRMVSGES
jgi:hypothetical protein